MSTQLPGRNASYLPNLQVMRFVAAVMVLLGHLVHETADQRVPLMTPLVDRSGIEWGSGVDIFFVISGFVMYYLSHERFAQAGYAGEFLRRRLVRVVPLYWAFTSLMLLALWQLPTQIRHTTFSWLLAGASYLFYPTTRADGLVRPVLALGWTLEYEVFFYVCFAMALINRRSIGIAGLVGGFLLLAVVGPTFPHSATALVFWSNPVILEFLLGMGVAHLYLTGVRLNALSQWSLTAVGIALMLLLTPLGWERLLWAGLPACILVAAAVLGPAWSNRWLELGGDCSYSLYLSHPFSLNLLAMLWARWHLPPSGSAYLVSGLFICTFAGLMVHRLLEVPLLTHLQRRQRPIGMESQCASLRSIGKVTTVARQRVPSPHELKMREGQI